MTSRGGVETFLRSIAKSNESKTLFTKTPDNERVLGRQVNYPGGKGQEWMNEWWMNGECALEKRKIEWETHTIIKSCNASAATSLLCTYCTCNFFALLILMKYSARFVGFSFFVLFSTPNVRFCQIRRQHWQKTPERTPLLGNRPARKRYRNI